MFKKFVLVLMLASAISMGACGKKDDNNNGVKTPVVNGDNGIGGDNGLGGNSKLLGSCTYNNGLSICEQISAPAATPTETLARAGEAFKQGCDRQRGNLQLTKACPTANAAGACRSKAGEQAQMIVVVYKGAFEFPVDQLKAQCEQQGLEFFQP